MANLALSGYWNTVLNVDHDRKLVCDPREHGELLQEKERGNYRLALSYLYN